mmetsp:Transcript_30255/g.52900  ORF Transcript_30255/g.52900 Transcript_30255/m.52900 type:complete len:111 (-) Transcript_30255:27-359(-)
MITALRIGTTPSPSQPKKISPPNTRGFRHWVRGLAQALATPALLFQLGWERYELDIRMRPSYFSRQHQRWIPEMPSRRQDRSLHEDLLQTAFRHRLEGYAALRHIARKVR